MRIRTLTAAAGLIAVLMMVAIFGSAEAGQLTGSGSVDFGFDENDNVIGVEKIIDGTVPPISEGFTVEVTCVATNGGPDLGPVPFRFGPDGIPPDLLPFGVGPNYTCTATETVTSGAQVSYACAATEPAQCTDDQTVVFGDFIGTQTTFTVTNTYEPPPGAVAAQPGAVAAQPAFTG